MKMTPREKRLRGGRKHVQNFEYGEYRLEGKFIVRLQSWEWTVRGPDGIWERVVARPFYTKAGHAELDLIWVSRHRWPNDVAHWALLRLADFYSTIATVSQEIEEILGMSTRSTDGGGA